MRILKKLRAKGGWTVVPVHYSHDPSKTVEWATREAENYLTHDAWEREMECNFEVVSGVRAYPNFSYAIHVSDSVSYNPVLPLRLCCDFNVGIMVWPVAQISNGIIRVIDEIVLRPASVPDMVREFRNRFPAHPAEVWIYGDAAGRARSANDQSCAYELIRISMAHYSSEVIMNVPVVNPPVKHRIDAMNLRLKSPSGEPRMVFSNKCKETIADMEEVLLAPNGGILKSNRPDDRYYERTHASDALGYMVAREFPVIMDIDEGKTRARRRRVPDGTFRIPGDL